MTSSAIWIDPPGVAEGVIATDGVGDPDDDAVGVGEGSADGVDVGQTVAVGVSVGVGLGVAGGDDTGIVRVGAGVEVTAGVAVGVGVAGRCDSSETTETPGLTWLTTISCLPSRDP
jgi:hypothetical protein